MIQARAAAVGLLAVVSACASAPQPTEHLASSIAAARSAETAGAAQVPQAALHLKLAEEQIQQAQEMIRKDENERADAMTIRAFNDAELALALTREAQAQRELMSFAEAHPELNQSPTSGATNAPIDAQNPPGPGAPKGAPDQAAD